MKLSWSIFARNRAWSKAMRRMRPRFESLEEEFAVLDLMDPIHEAILVGVTDEHNKDFIEVVSNRDGYFQVLVGFDSSIGLGADNDYQLECALFQQLSRAIIACPFALPDRECVKAALDRWKADNLKLGG